MRLCLLYTIDLVCNLRDNEHFLALESHISTDLCMNCKYVRSYEPVQRLGPQIPCTSVDDSNLPAVRHRCHLSHKVSCDPIGCANPRPSIASA